MSSKKKFDLPAVAGIGLALLSGLAAIGVGIYITHDAGYLWSLILLIWGLERVVDSVREYEWKPVVLGGLMALMYLGLAAVIWYVQNPDYLWAMILVHWVADAIV